MQPALGWAGLSRSALKRAEAQLMSDSEGMRDEVGVLSLHTGYANRFFPGTSVQQSRIRYALFIPWQIQALLKQGDAIRPGQARAALEMAELALAKRLPDADGEGTIGRRTAKLGKPVAIAPSQSYWVALKTWNILAGDLFGISAARSELFARWSSWPQSARSRIKMKDDDSNPIHSLTPLFHPRFPEPPRAFSGSGPLDFTLGAEERMFLRTRLMETRRSLDGKPSYLANLVQEGVSPGKESYPWTPTLAKHADLADRAALERARGAASLAAVTRAIYNAMVESLQEDRDGGSPSNIHRSRLQEVVAEHGPLAGKLDLSGLPLDGLQIGDFSGVLDSVQSWLRKDGRNPLAKDLLEILACWELRRKGFRRARLPGTMSAKLARKLWVGDETVQAGPIEFRWSLVRRFLQDLEG